VEDRGGAIKGTTIDLFHRRHAEALQWGRRKLKVRPLRVTEDYRRRQRVNDR